MNENLFFMAHGAGAGHTSDFLKLFSASFCRTVSMPYIPITFNYMQLIEKTEKMRPPPRFNYLVNEFEQALNAYDINEKKIIVAGKSMGGRVATQLSNHPAVVGIVCFGFPFYQQGNPAKNRLSFLSNLNKPCLIFQGTRDAFGKPDWVNEQTLPEWVDICWIEGANHDFQLLKRQNKEMAQVIDDMLLKFKAWSNKLLIE